MKITLIIPTCSSGRISLLIRSVESIQAGVYKNVHPVIVADGNQHIADVANEKLHNVSVISNEKRIGWIASINRVLREFDSEYYIFSSDDLEYPPDCIKNALRTHLTYFLDGMGVVSIGRKTRCCFGLFGQKFADHFPDRQVFCPDYFHYCSDTELFRTIQKLEIYAYPPDRQSQVIHHRLKDETYRLAHLTREKDYAIRDKRQEKGYQWGIDFNLIKKND